MQRPDIAHLARLVVDHRCRSRWWADAACEDMAGDDFFGEHPTDAATAACVNCPVLVDCLADELGIDSEEIHGYRAGLDAPTRRRVLTEAGRLLPSDGDLRKARARAAVSAGASIRQVALNEGVSTRTVHRWLAA